MNMSIHKEADLPRVSTILRILEDSYSGVPLAALEKAAERGEALHRLCLTYLAALGGMCEAIDLEDVPHEYRKAFLSFVGWCDDNKVEPVSVEQGDVCSKHKFKGTPDALVLFGPDRILLLLDLKFTATILRINIVQLLAYWILDLYKDAKRAMLLHIKPLTGELKAHNVKKNPRDMTAFLNALSVYRWRQS